MKIQIIQENLKRALASVSRVADSRGSLPILGNILIKSEQGHIIISATNLEIAISRTVTGRVEKPGSITVPAKLMNDLISSFPNEAVDIETEESKVHINCASHKATINGLSAEEFPEIPRINNKQPIEISADDLKEALTQTVFAASNDEARPVLTGVLFSSEDKKLTMVATDSYRLAEKKLTNTNLDQDALIPATAAQDLLRTIQESDEQIELLIEEAQAQFTIGETTLITRLVDGQFPDYKKLLPKNNETKVMVNRKELVSVAKTASLFARESAGSITLQVSEGDQSIHVASVASQIGENQATISAKVENDGDITLNSRFLIDALNAITSEKIEISFSGKVKPCLIKPVGDETYLHVVMPLKT